jgi:hypothetical protein
MHPTIMLIPPPAAVAGFILDKASALGYIRLRVFPVFPENQ